MPAEPKLVLIPHDGSTLSGQVVKAAQSLLTAGTRVVLVHVDTSGQDDVTKVQEAAAELKALGVDVSERNERSDDAAAALLNNIEQDSPALVLMGTHGRSGSGRFIRGSVAERMLCKCPQPLLMINPSTQTPLPLRSVLVPLDASDSSFEIISPLVDLISGTGAKVTLLFVDFDDPTDTEELRTNRREQRKADIAAWFDRPSSRIAAAGLNVNIRVEHGNPAEKILQVANDPDYDLLAMTTHGRSGVARWAFGSVAEKVLGACEKPILLKRIK